MTQSRCENGQGYNKKKERKPNGTLILAEIENLHLRLMLQIFVANQHYPLAVYLKEIMPVYWPVLW